MGFLVWFLGIVIGCISVIAGVAAAPAVEGLKISAGGDHTTVAINLNDVSRYRLFTLTAPDRVVLDILPARLAASALPLPAGAGLVRQMRAANRPDGSVRVVLELSTPVESRATLQRTGMAGAPFLQLDLAPVSVLSEAVARQSAVVPMPVSEPPTPAAASSAPGTPSSAVTSQTPSVPAPPASAGREIVIAVDAGHGGKDPGARGPHGVLEKDVTLQMARRLVEIINAEPGMRGVLTRSRDELIPLRGRMERARNARADLFVSIHADAVRNRRIQGASVYVLNEKGATDEAAKRLAARENAADLIGGVSLGDKDPVLRSVLLDLSQNASLSSSIEIADEILAHMARVGAVRKRQVMQAPFMVLKSPDVPSVLIESAYISNPEEEKQLDSNEYRSRLAGAIFAGMRDYFYRNPPRGTLVAELSRQRLAESIQHIVRPGETLSVIASRYNTGVQRIRDVNQLKTDRVAVGQVLRIPAARDT